MQTYEVIDRPVTFGMGIELKLSPNQAESRTSSLRKKGSNIYTVIEQVHFKRGEVIAVISGNLSKLTLEHLREVSSATSDKIDDEIASITKNDSNSTEYPNIQHAGFGRYNVFDQDGNLLNSKPLRKNEAEKILSKLTGASEKNDQRFEESTDEIDVNNLPLND